MGYSIDMVVEGKSDRRLAIECDGDQYHGPERWADDMMRQRVLRSGLVGVSGDVGRQVSPSIQKGVWPIFSAHWIGSAFTHRPENLPEKSTPSTASQK